VFSRALKRLNTRVWKSTGDELVFTNPTGTIVPDIHGILDDPEVMAIVQKRGGGNAELNIPVGVVLLSLPTFHGVVKDWFVTTADNLTYRVDKVLSDGGETICFLVKPESTENDKLVDTKYGQWN
jgi:hypothetical protein